MKTKILLFLGLLGCVLDTFSANANYRFRTMSPEGGFYYDGVKEIEQDQTGFIWVMMDYELYRFDGYHYKNIIHICKAATDSKMAFQEYGIRFVGLSVCEYEQWNLSLRIGYRPF